MSHTPVGHAGHPLTPIDFSNRPGERNSRIPLIVGLGCLGIVLVSILAMVVWIAVRLIAGTNPGQTGDVDGYQPLKDRLVRTAAAWRTGGLPPPSSPQRTKFHDKAESLITRLQAAHRKKDRKSLKSILDRKRFIQRVRNCLVSRHARIPMFLAEEATEFLVDEDWFDSVELFHVETSAESPNRVLLYVLGKSNDMESMFEATLWCALNGQGELVIYDWETTDYGLTESEWVANWAMEKNRDLGMDLMNRLEAINERLASGDSELAIPDLEYVDLMASRTRMGRYIDVQSGYIWNSLGRFDKSIDPARVNSLKLATSYPGTFSSIAGAFYELGDYRQSLEYLERYESLVGPSPPTCAFKSEVLKMLGRGEEARESIGDYLRVRPNDVQFLGSFAALIESDQIDMFRQKLQRTELSESALVELAMECFYYDGAATLATVAEQVTGADAGKTWVGPFVQGLIAEQNDDWASALSQYHDALTKTHVAENRDRILGRLYYLVEHFDEADVVLGDQVTPSAFVETIAAFNADDEPPIAGSKWAQWLDRYVEREPDNATAWELVGTIAEYAGDHSKAAAALRKAASCTDVDSKRQQEYRSWAAYQLVEDRQYADAVDLAPTAETLIHIAEIFIQRKDADQFAWLIQRAKTVTDLPLALKTWFEANEKLFAGDSTGAFELLQQGVSQTTNDERVAWLLKNSVLDLIIQNGKWELIAQLKPLHSWYPISAHRFESAGRWEGLRRLNERALQEMLPWDQWYTNELTRIAQDSNAGDLQRALELGQQIDRVGADEAEWNYRRARLAFKLPDGHRKKVLESLRDSNDHSTPTQILKAYGLGRIDLGNSNLDNWMAYSNTLDDLYSIPELRKLIPREKMEALRQEHAWQISSYGRFDVRAVFWLDQVPVINLAKIQAAVALIGIDASQGPPVKICDEPSIETFVVATNVGNIWISTGRGNLLKLPDDLAEIENAEWSKEIQAASAWAAVGCGTMDDYSDSKLRNALGRVASDLFAGSAQFSYLPNEYRLDRCTAESWLALAGNSLEQARDASEKDTYPALAFQEIDPTGRPIPEGNPEVDSAAKRKRARELARQVKEKLFEFRRGRLNELEVGIDIDSRFAKQRLWVKVEAVNLHPNHYQVLGRVVSGSDLCYPVRNGDKVDFGSYDISAFR